MVATDVASRGIGKISDSPARFPTHVPLHLLSTISYRVIRFMLCSFLLVRSTCRCYYNLVQGLLSLHTAPGLDSPTDEPQDLCLQTGSVAQHPLHPAVRCLCFHHDMMPATRHVLVWFGMLRWTLSSRARVDFRNFCIQHSSIHNNTICYSFGVKLRSVSCGSSLFGSIWANISEGALLRRVIASKSGQWLLASKPKQSENRFSLFHVKQGACALA